MQPKTQAMPLIQYKTIQYTFSTPSKIINTYTKSGVVASLNRHRGGSMRCRTRPHIASKSSAMACTVCTCECRSQGHEIA